MKPKNVRILLVEDNPDDIELVLRVLKKHNLANEITVARDGEEALDILFQRWRDVAGGQQPDLILLNLKLPKVDGLEVLRQVKSYPETQLTPVVLLTSSNEEDDIRESYRGGGRIVISVSR